MSFTAANTEDFEGRRGRCFDWECQSRQLLSEAFGEFDSESSNVEVWEFGLVFFWEHLDR